jgi:glycosyltransferase involved in cell wall biosynthesis
VDRPGKYLPLRRNLAYQSDFAIARHARHLLKSMADGNRRKRIAYLWHPSFWPYVNLLRADYVVFHIYDPWNAGAWSAFQRQNLKSLAERADLVIATAETMSRDLPGIGPNRARILPHGVDFKAVAAGAGAPCPADLAKIPRPRIGYTGRINIKNDLHTIAEVAARRPDWHWVLVGQAGIGASRSLAEEPSVKAIWNRMSQLNNIHLLGVKDRAEIPAYLHHFDVLSLPYNSSFLGFPTKLYEYFASGKPIVSWKGENVMSHSHLIGLADGPDEWIAAIDRAVAGKGPGSSTERVETGRAQDWDRRTDTLETWLLEMMERR